MLVGVTDGCGPVVLLELGQRGGDDVMLGDDINMDIGCGGQPREYLLVRDIEGPLGENGFERMTEAEGPDEGSTAERGESA